MWQSKSCHLLYAIFYIFNISWTQPSKPKYEIFTKGQGNKKTLSWEGFTDPLRTCEYIWNCGTLCELTNMLWICCVPDGFVYLLFYLKKSLASQILLIWLSDYWELNLKYKEENIGKAGYSWDNSELMIIFG